MRTPNAISLLHPELDVEQVKTVYAQLERNMNSKDWVLANVKIGSNGQAPRLYWIVPLNTVPKDQVKEYLIKHYLEQGWSKVEFDKPREESPHLPRCTVTFYE